tara:strand:- start:1810 stop:2010 length:201 start_codon:yes stop_codon:yes gene_type:complete
MTLREKDIDFARYKELNSLLQWMTETQLASSEEQLECYLGIKNELLRRIISLDEKHMTLGAWGENE